MSKDKKPALKASVEIQRPEDGDESEVAFYVVSGDGNPLTGNQILEAIAEALVLHWPNNPLEERHFSEFDS